MWLNAKFAKQRTEAHLEVRTQVSNAPKFVDSPSRPAVRKAIGTEVESKFKSVFDVYDRLNSHNGCLESEVLNNTLASQNDGNEVKSELSVSEYPSCGYRLLINDCNNRVAIPQNLHKPLPIWDVPKPPECVLRVAVTSADRSCSFEVNALFSIDAQITSVSETLACKLGLKKKGVLICSGLGCTGLKAYPPIPACRYNLFGCSAQPR